MKDCVFFRGWEIGVPVTYHVSIGTDIIDQHPTADFAAKGQTSGIDFKYFTASIAKLHDGVHMNIGSAVTEEGILKSAFHFKKSRLSDISYYNTTLTSFLLVITVVISARINTIIITVRERTLSTDRPPKAVSGYIFTDTMRILFLRFTQD